EQTLTAGAPPPTGDGRSDHTPRGGPTSVGPPRGVVVPARGLPAAKAGTSANCGPPRPQAPPRRSQRDLADAEVHERVKTSWVLPQTLASALTQRRESGKHGIWQFPRDL